MSTGLFKNCPKIVLLKYCATLRASPINSAKPPARNCYNNSMRCDICGDAKYLMKWRVNPIVLREIGLDKPKSSTINVCNACKTSIIEAQTGILCENSSKFVKNIKEIA